MSDLNDLGCEKLNVADIRICRAGGSLPACNWVRQRICNGGKRGLDT